jgi:hypothetical protein
VLDRAIFAMAVITALSARDVRGQSDNNGAGWVALMVTPIGALTPIGPAAANDTMWYQLQLRYGHWQSEGVANMHTFGFGVALRTGSTRMVIEFGYARDASCQDCNYTMLGVDLDVPLIQQTESETGRLRVALNPAAGIGDGSGTAVSGALSVPFSVAFPAGDMSLIPFISPGIGYGRSWAGNESAGAPRSILAAGIRVARERSALRVTISAHKVFLTGAPMVYGVGLSIGPPAG